MPSPTADLTTEPLVVRGPTLKDALATAEAAFGRPARAIKADRIRRGGIGGFFATDLGVEITAVPYESDLGPIPTITPPAPRPATPRPSRTAPINATSSSIDDELESILDEAGAPALSFEETLDRLVNDAQRRDGPRVAPRPRAVATAATVGVPALNVSTSAPLPPAAPRLAPTPVLPAPAASTAVPAASPFAGLAERLPDEAFASPRLAAAFESRQADAGAVTAPATASTAMATTEPSPALPEVLREELPTRVRAELAASAAGELLGQIMSHPDAGAVTVTITIASPDGAEVRAEARVARMMERHDEPFVREA